MRAVLGRLTAFAVALCVVYAVLAAGEAVQTAYALPERAIDDALTRPVLHVSVTETGAVVEHGCACDRTLRADELPDIVRDALIATEDRRFMEHGAVDPLGIARALVVSVRNRVQTLFDGRPRGSEGGSTLSQQLAKVSLTGSEGGLRRKAAEAMLAHRIERLYTKDDIVRLYLSRVSFGWVEGGAVYGLRDAARVWFGKRPAELTVEEAAILVGMINAPSAYNPLRHPDRAAARAQLVLRRMETEGVLPRAAKGPLRAHLPTEQAKPPLRDRYVEDMLRAEFKAVTGRSGVSPGHYRVVSTLDAIAQYRARQFVSEEVRDAGGLGVSRAALVSLDRDGRVLALVGDTDYRRSTFNIAARGERQAASTAKIATYLAAVENGWRPEDVVWDDPDRLRDFRPRNDDGRYRGAIEMHECLRESRNACTVWLAEEVGLGKVRDMAERIGLTIRRPDGRDVVLGAADSNPMQAAAAFATLVNGGLRMTPRSVSRVIGPLGKSHWSGIPDMQATGLTPTTIETMRALLREVVTDGTGRRAAFFGADSFGKTGTSQENRDAWFVGFTTDDITTAVWVGPREGGRMSGVTGGGLPAKIYARYNLSLVDRFHAYTAGAPLPR